MKAWRVHELGDPRDVLRLDDVPEPSPGPGQVVVRVLGCPANFPDVLMCRGEYQVKPPMPFTPGIEVCGEVVASGSREPAFAQGARVIGMPTLPFGGFAEYALTPEEGTFPCPPELNDAEAASFFIGYQTAWFALHRRARMRPAETLLVHAAAGGVGSAAVQLGKAAGAQVIAVVGGPEKGRVAEQLGADRVVDRHREDFVPAVQEFTSGRGADVVYDPVGGDSYRRSTKCVAFEGRIIVIGFAGGEIQSAALNHALVKNYSIVGLHWGLYSSKNPAVVAECHDQLCELVAAGRIKPLTSEIVDLSGVPDALQRLAEGRTVGRVVSLAHGDLGGASRG